MVNTFLGLKRIAKIQKTNAFLIWQVVVLNVVMNFS